MNQILKAGDIMLVGITIPEGYDGVEISIAFDDFCNDPNGWRMTLEGSKPKGSES